ncbi:MAG TPA: hypothetical protein VG605_03605 [Puia sp.]|nr:hypothetical protein [Puia sp.]
MRYQYVVILKKTSERATDVLSLLLCLFSAVSFLLSALHTHRPWLDITLAAILLAGLLFNLVAARRKHKNSAGVRYRYWLLLAAIGWIGATSTPWVGAFFFLLAFLEYQTKRPLEIGFNHDKIVMNTLIKRRFDWSLLNNVILKDGLLTLDFKDNHLVQKEVLDDEDEDDADEEEFNAWCRAQLAAADKISV